MNQFNIHIVHMHDMVTHMLSALVVKKQARIHVFVYMAYYKTCKMRSGNIYGLMNRNVFIYVENGVKC